jgi:hypothetical protein
MGLKIEYTLIYISHEKFILAMKMGRNSKLSILDQIYKIYNDFIRTQDLACRKYCSVCCTSNVTLTTIEGYKIVDDLIVNKKFDLFGNLQKALPTNNFRPRTTTNRIAQLCAEGKNFSEADPSLYAGVCPLLTKQSCSIYGARPFGCRCLVSRQPCEKKGFAEIDDFVLTVNTLFMQVIEHVDRHGLSGNLTDVLLFLGSNDERLSGQKTIVKISQKNLIPNQPLTILMIPPEHRDQIKPLLRSLQNIST